MKRSFKKFTERLEHIGLREPLEKRARAHHISLLDLYEGPSLAQSVKTARKNVYLWLVGEGKGINEIARLFDRAPSSVWKMVQKKSVVRKTRGKAKAI